MYLLKINAIHWDENERTGYRHVSVSIDGVNHFAVAAHHFDSVWTAKAYPMGYSYDSDAVQDLVDFMLVLPKVMKFLEQDTVLTDVDVLSFIQELSNE